MIKYLYAIFFILLISIASYTIYSEITKKEIESRRLECHKEVITYETVHKPDKIPFAIKLLKSGNYKLKSNFRYSIHMPTKLAKYLNSKDADAMINKIISQYITQRVNSKEKLIINYLVDENDKADPNKKSASCRINAGYIYLSFELNHERIYDIQLEYMDDKTRDLYKRIECAVKSFLSSP